MSINIKYLSYLAGAIEAVSSKEMKSWRDEIENKLASPDLYFYNPVKQESVKVGKESKDQVQYIAGLKQSGNWEKFAEEMEKIWFGKIDTLKFDKVRLFIYLYEKARLEGNFDTDLPLWGDYEATVRSNFIIAYMPKDVKTVGTLLEIHICYLFSIPVYLILPDQSKTDANSTLVDIVMKSGGEIFYNIKECCDYIRDKYKLKEIKEEKK
jgi:hypothetical protein